MDLHTAHQTDFLSRQWIIQNIRKIFVIRKMDKDSWTYSIPFTALFAAMGSIEYSSMTCIILKFSNKTSLF